VDTNVLVAAHLPGVAFHQPLRQRMQALAADPDVVLVLTPLVLHEFLHIVTDPRRFEPPVPMSEAVELTRRYVNRSNVACIPVTEGALSLALDLLDRHGSGRKRIADTLLAATLLSDGVDELLTCNPDDFHAFEGLRVVDPRLSGEG
jgi:toxin-antitoxin system PIN domain toxin